MFKLGEKNNFMRLVYKLIERKLEKKKKTRKHNSQNILILKDKIKKIIKLQKKI